MPKTVLNAAKRFGLTERERQVFFLRIKGWTQKAIAADLQISYWTVDFHVRNILRKMGVHSSAEFFSVCYGVK